nr:hypothetical protein [Candidatus Freyarchaeota archaeon]
MYNLRTTNSGISILDSLLGGGFLSNSIIVLSFQSGVKFWELVHRIIYNNYDDKFHLILVTFHLSQQQLVNRLKVSQQSDKHYKEVMESLTTGSVSVIDCFSVSEGEEGDSQKGNVHYVSNPFNVNNLLSVMAQVRESVPGDKRVYWLFHNLTNMSVGVPEDDLLKFCRKMFRYHKQRGDLAVYLLNEYAHTDKFFAKIYQLSDVFIKLIAEETSWGLENSVQVIKGVFPFQSKKVFYDINENEEIIFRNKKMDIKPQVPTSTFSTITQMEKGGEKAEGSKFIRTGIPKLDSLLGGGMLSNSITVASYQYGVRTIETMLSIFQNQLGRKTHLIQIAYRFALDEYLTRFKLSEPLAEITKGSLDLFSHGDVSVIDCLNLQQDETNTQKNNIYHLSNPFDVDKLLSLMSRVRDSVSKDKSVFWMFSSLTDMSIGVPEDELLKFCRRAFRYHKWCGDLALYTLTEQAHSEMFRAKLYQLSDVFIKFLAEDTREGINTSIQILKSAFNYDSKKSQYILNEKGQIQFLED